MGILETMIDIPAEHEKNVFGQFDIFAKKIERALHVTLIARNGKVKVLGEEKNVEKAQQVLSQTYRAFQARKHDPGAECRLCPVPYDGRQRGRYFDN